MTQFLKEKMEVNKAPIWFSKTLSLVDLQAIAPQYLSGHLGMEWLSVGPDYIQMRMPVDDRTRQPYGLLHGGASCALSETIGSVASFLIIDTANFKCVGLEINANHLRAVNEGWVTATATAFHLGKTTHVWNIRITDQAGNLVCISRLTVAILALK